MPMFCTLTYSIRILFGRHYLFTLKLTNLRKVLLSGMECHLYLWGFVKSHKLRTLLELETKNHTHD